MSSNSNFNIQVFGPLIVVDFNGEWSEQDDLNYVSSLAEQIARLNRHSWGILVDMRGWVVQKAATEPTFKISLDRRNQKVECWIVDNLQQGDFLLPHFQDAPVKPLKFLNPSDAIKCLEKVGFSLPKTKFFFKSQ